MKRILIGFRGDCQTESVAMMFDFVFLWHEFLKNWTFILKPNGMDIVSSDETYCLADCETLIRGNPALAGINDPIVSTLFMHLMNNQYLYPRAGSSPLNKLGQLRSFGKLAPKTLVIKSKDACNIPASSITKSISNTRSKVALSTNFASQGPIELTCPTLFQEFIKGQEYKVSGFYRKGIEQLLLCKISTEETDYRYADKPAKFELSRDVPGVIRAICRSIHRDTNAGFFDLDYLITKDGNCKVLEWNNAPAPASTEMEVEGRLSFSKNLSARFIPVILASKSDEPSKLVHLGEENKSLLLNFEDYGSSWIFYCTDGKLCFESQGVRIWPTKIYLREVQIDPKHKYKDDLHRLFLLLNIFHANVVSAPSRSFFNGSKLLQQLKTIRPGKELANNQAITLPKSFIIKGRASVLANLRKKEPELIVKSGSGVRSRVVDEAVFSEFDATSLINTPVLFQKTYQGSDLRVHYLNEKAFAKIIWKKSEIDYRYAEERSTFEDYPVDEALRLFCKAVSELEVNPFMGIDFLKTNDGYVCLEANPSPGWSWYYPLKTENEFFHSEVKGLIYEHA